jgi:predicted GNAT family acetyltransferase
MAHVLDNPVWNALLSGNKHLTQGTAQAKYFAQDVSPFVGLPDTTPQDFGRLYDSIPYQGPFGVITPTEIVIPAPWKVTRQTLVLQLTCEYPAAPRITQSAITPLSNQQVPAMLALTKSTNPGPFFSNTIAFGHYEGIFDGEELIAMAGQRLHPAPYAEISAVCTHPNYLGKNYASQLLLHQIHRIKAAAGIPFLHVKADNTRAIRVYETLGFVLRREMNIYFIQKN